MLIISESGLYNLIFRSRKPEAKKFRKWVTAEVLPSIRKTGMYIEPDSMDCRAADGIRNDGDGFGGLPDRTMQQWINLVRETRLLFGRDAARAVWNRSPLPKINAVEAAVRADAVFDASAFENAVRDVLATPFKGGTIADFVRARADFKEMQSSGVRPFFLDGKKYYAFGNGFFGDTARKILLSHPQSRIYPVSVRFGVVAVRAVLVPAGFVERAADDG